MPVYTVTCPECRKGLRSSKPVPAGKLVTCPKCGVMFAAPPPQVEGVEVVEDVEVVENVEVVEDDAPRRKPRRAAVEDDDDERPRRKPKRKSSGKGPVIAVVAGLCVLLLVGGGALAYWLLAGGGEEPLAYVPADSQVVIGADLTALWDTPLGPQIEKLLDSGAGPPGLAKYKRESGLSNRELAHALVFSRRAGIGGGTIVLKNAAGYDAAKVATAMGGSGKTTTVAGRSVYTTGTADKLYQPAKKVVVFAEMPDDALGNVVRSGGTKSALGGDVAKLIEKAKGSALWGAVTKDALQNPAAAGAMAGMPGGAAAMQTLQSASAFGFWAKVSGTDVELTAAIALPDAAAKSVADQSQSAPKANPVMLALLPEAVRGLVQELSESAKASTDGNLALTTMRVKMSTLESAIGAAATMIPRAPPGGRDGRGRGPGG